MVFFNSSMPRSGSTLLQNIIGQNPKFYVTPTSGVIELIHGAKVNYSNSPEFKAQDSILMKKAFLSFCKHGIEGYFKGITSKEYILDKSRGWSINYELLTQLFEKPKIICMVRDLRDIIASMEKNYRKNIDKISGLANYEKLIGTTVNKRVDIYLNSIPVGISLDRLLDTFQQNIAKNIYFARYEDLLMFPEKTMQSIYDFLEIDNFKHDFEDIKQITNENDNVYGIFGDHKIKTKLQPLESNFIQILGKQISMQIKNKYDWYFKTFKY